MTAMEAYAVRDGNRVLRFMGELLASSTSKRPGIQRWSELAIYRASNGEYLLSKVGRSSVAHDPGCRYVTRRMPSWLDALEEGKVHRTACVECQPLVGDRMDPHTRLEVQRYTVYRSETLQMLVDILTENRDKLPPVVEQLVSRLP